MRIVSGKLKGIRFQPPKSFDSRPTTDFAKEGIFNVLENNYDFSSMRILDLFAGTGNVSFEFASRGAEKVIAVDRNFRCVKFIDDFGKKHQLDNLLALKADVLNFIQQHSAAYDLIFADPPFKFQSYEQLISEVLSSALLAENGIFILEHEKRIKFDELPSFDYERKYGNVVFSIFKKQLRSVD
jgi:16S rRNA (guanine(966)-N(2))-methyltransferase RsmD